MEDLFKKLIYTGVGIVSNTAEKLQKSVDELVDKGKISEDEGKKVVDDFVDGAEAKKEEFEDKLRSVVENMLSKFDFPTRDEVKILQERIQELEGQLPDNGVKKVIAKKTTAAKKVVVKKIDEVKEAVKDVKK